MKQNINISNDEDYGVYLDRQENFIFSRENFTEHRVKYTHVLPFADAGHCICDVTDDGPLNLDRLGGRWSI